MTLLEAAKAVVDARYNHEEWDALNEAIGQLSDTLDTVKADTSVLDDLSVIRTIASPPHHENALSAIEAIAIKAIAKMKGGEA